MMAIQVCTAKDFRLCKDSGYSLDIIIIHSTMYYSSIWYLIIRISEINSLNAIGTFMCPYKIEKTCTLY